MKKLIKIVIVTVILSIQLFNLNALADGDRYKSIVNKSDFNLLSQEVLDEILSFLADLNDPEKWTLEKIKKLQELTAINKIFDTLVEYVLDKYQDKTDEYLNHLVMYKIAPLEAALTLATPFAAKWLKNKASKNSALQDEINESLLTSTEYGDKEMVQFLIDAGANINIQHEKGYRYTPLMIATILKYKEIIKLLIKAGANLNAQDARKETALMSAVIQGSEHIVKLLIDAGADLNIRNSYGDTALDIAKRDYRVAKRHNTAKKGNYKKIVKILKNVKKD